MSGAERAGVISSEREGHVATLFIDRPEKRNAMNMAFFEQLAQEMTALSEEPEVRCVVLAARGPHFSVGLDLTALAALAPAGGSGPEPSPAETARRTHDEVLRLQRAISSAAECKKPVIAAVHGYCIGGGVDLVSACDIRLAARDAVFSVRETKMAIVADVGSLQRLPRIIGKGHVAELAYTGRDVDAARALAIGLVNHVHPDAASTVAAAQALAAEIAGNSPLVVQGTKAVLSACEDRSVADGLDYVATYNAGMLQTDDLVEATSAFLEKRPPRFEGR